MYAPSVPHPRTAQGRVLIFIVLRDTDRAGAEILSRIPRTLVGDGRVHFLIMDEGPVGSDRAEPTATHWLERNSFPNLTFLRNPLSQGYGGNQKLGYRYALDHGYDFTILLHADGRCAPELLPELIRVWDETGADVVLGARGEGHERQGARPLRERARSAMLGSLQSLVVGRQATDWDSHYRAYSTRFLASVPFESNTNEPHFDTELLLQAIHVGAQIEELPIPARHAKQPGRSGGTGRAGDVGAALLQFKMHQMGMLCSLKYRDLSPERYQDKTGMFYSSHRVALALIEDLAPKTLLDLGSGPGFVGQRCQEMGIRVTGVDVVEPRPGSIHSFVAHDLEQPNLPIDPFEYDVVTMLDVIEHLKNPEEFLISLRNRSRALKLGRRAAKLVLSTPNIAFAAVRANLALGRFNYAERGILDISHKRLFTRDSLLRMLIDCGYEIERVIPIGAPFEAVVEGPVGRVLGRQSEALSRAWPTLFAFQFMVVASPRPSIRQILSESEPRVFDPAVRGAR